MSVLLTARGESRAEYVNTAHEIYCKTLSFLTKLSARYSRLMAHDISQEAFNLVTFCIKANSVYLNSESNKKLREQYLLKARGSLEVLITLLGDCYEIMSMNPEGCFSTRKGSSVSAKEASERLDKMADELGNLLEKEGKLINGMIYKTT